MHEASIAQSILRIACEKLTSLGVPAMISNIKIAVGEFRNVDSASLEFAFNSLKKEYFGCEKCQLDIKVIEAIAECRQCKTLYHPEFDRSFRCTECGDGIGKLLEGEQLGIIGIRLESAGEEMGNYARSS